MIKEVKISLLFLLLASCTVGPDYKRPQMYSDSSMAQSLNLTTAAADTQIVKDWYRQFNDETLNQLVAMSLKNSPNVKMAIEKMRQARESLEINAVQYLPMIDADGSYHYNNSSRKIGFTIDTDYYQTGLDASWELDIWGSGRRLTESSAALLKAAASDLNNVYVSMTAEVAANYINLRSYQEQLRIAEKNLALQEKIYHVVAEKYKFGLESDVALNQAKYAIETTKSTIPDLRKAIEAYQNALAILVGRLPGQLDVMLAANTTNLVHKRFNYNLAKLYELPVDVVRNRPDVEAAEQQLIAQNALIGKAIADLFPNISLSGFMGFQATEVSGLFGSKSFMYTYTPAVTLPLLHWGQLQNQVKLQEDITREAFYAYQSSILNATSEIKNSMVAVTQEYNKNASAYQAAKAQKTVTSLMLKKYKMGLVEFSDVLTVEQNLLSSQNALAVSNGQIYQNIIAFYKAIGGGYQLDKGKCLQKSLGLNGFACNAL